MIYTVANGVLGRNRFHSLWGASVPQGTELDRESVNPAAKMKLRPGCHNLFASMPTSSKAVCLRQVERQQQSWLDIHSRRSYG